MRISIIGAFIFLPLVLLSAQTKAETSLAQSILVQSSTEQHSTEQSDLDQPFEEPADCDLDFDKLLDEHFDPTKPKTPQEVHRLPVTYIPACLRALGFELLVRYITLHEAIKFRLLMLKRYFVSTYNNER